MADATDPTPPAPPPAPANWLTRNWHYVTIAIAVLGWAVTAYHAFKAGTPIPPPPDIASKPAGGDDAPRPFGWLDNPDAVEKVAATLPIRAFRDTPAHQAMGDAPDHAYLWEAAKKARGGTHIPTLDQGDLGSCVANGAENAVEYMECVELVLQGVNFADGGKFRQVSSEVIYGGSRVQIGNGAIPCSEAGSTGAWAAKWCQQYGVVARGKYGKYDLSAYSIPTCKKFGCDGCPAELLAEAKKHPVKSITKVATTEELRKSLANGYPVTVASNVGFGMRGPYKRDKDGYLKASGTWPHQMCFVGYATINGQFAYYCMNSWGPTWVSGPTGPGDPPPGGFYVHEGTASKMLAQGDSWAYASLTGFLPQRLDWAAAPKVRQEGLFALNPFRGVSCEVSYSLAP